MGMNDHDQRWGEATERGRADPVATHDVHVLGARLAYEIGGDGPVDIVWGHGLGQTRVLDAQSNLVDWSQVPARVLRYDARGHGDSETTPDLAGYTWEALAHDQLALAASVGMDRYVAAGASMGCGTAVHVAAIAPDRTRGLLLVIPPTAWETRAAQGAQWSQLAATLRRPGGVEAAIEASRARPVPDPFQGDEARRAQTEAGVRSWDPDRLAHAWLGAAAANLPERDVVAGITAPTLILAWTGDPVHPAATAHELAHLLPHAEMHIASTRKDLDGWTGIVAEFVARL